MMFDKLDKETLLADAKAWVEQMEREKQERFAMIDEQDRSYRERMRNFENRDKEE